MHCSHRSMEGIGYRDVPTRVMVVVVAVLTTLGLSLGVVGLLKLATTGNIPVYIVHVHVGDL